MNTWNTMNTIGIAIVSYALGVLTGYYGCSFFGKQLKLDGDSYKNLVLILVSIGWFTSVIYEVVNPSFSTNPLIHGLMGGIVGFFFKTTTK